MTVLIILPFEPQAEAQAAVQALLRRLTTAGSSSPPITAPARPLVALIL
jgi:hypothetical protein